MMITAFVLFTSVAHAAKTPALYCISTESFHSKNSWPVNQIEIFTNDKGSMQMRLQFHAWGQSEVEVANITTDSLLRLNQLSFDASTKTLSNSSQKFVLTLQEDLSPNQAKAILSKKEAGFDFVNPAGLAVNFKKLSLAKLSAFDYPGKSNEWSGTLMEAFKAGVNEYICGNHKDVQK